MFKNGLRDNFLPLNNSYEIPLMIFCCSLYYGFLHFWGFGGQGNGAGYGVVFFL